MNPAPTGYKTTTSTTKNCNTCKFCVALNGVLYCNRNQDKPSGGGGMYLTAWCKANQTGFNNVCDLWQLLGVNRMVITRG